MAKKIKIFSTKDNSQKLENEINQWFLTNDDIKIIEVSSSDSRDAQSGFIITIAIIYEWFPKSIEEETNIHRDHERKDLFDIVDYMVDGNYYRDFAEDISASGVFIRTKNVFKEGQNTLITFMTPGMERPLKIKGEIARILAHGIGIKFKSESQVQDDMIKTLIKALEK
jgi:hypothetical protein